MKKSKLLSLLSALLICAAVVHAKDKSILIALQPTDSLSGNIPFNSVQVVDARVKKDNLGTSSLQGRKPAFITHDSLATELKNFVGKMMASATGNPENELLLVVHDLQLNDLARPDVLIKTIHVHMACYLGNNGFYTPAHVVDTLIEMPSGKKPSLADVTSTFLTYTVFQAATGNISTAGSNRTLVDLLSQEGEARQHIPVYNQPAKAGIYYTFEQFKNLTPGDTEFTGFSHIADEVRYTRFYLGKDKKNRKSLSDTACFAVYYKDKWHFPFGAADFGEMKMIDGDFYYYQMLYGLTYTDYSSIAAVGTPYGAIGGALAGGIAAGLKNKQDRSAPKYGPAIFRLKLDPITGEGHKQSRVR